MATCRYCEHRKGKRSCPALAGAICSACCGQHRLRDIDCPADCVHLGGLAVARAAVPVAFTKEDLGSAWGKLHAYAERAATFRNEALSRVIEDPELTSWELDLAVGYVFHGHRDAGGRRLVDHFIAARGRDLTRGEMAAVVALRDAWASLFEVESVHAGIGLELRDLRSGERHRVRELLAPSQVVPGDVMFAWLMTVTDHVELSAVTCLISRPHREAVRRAIEEELEVARTRWPGIPERELVGSTAWVVAEVMRTPEHGQPAGEPGPVAEAPAATTYDASHAPVPDEWMATDDESKRAAIEAHHRALGVAARPIHAELHLIVENQLAAGDPPEARAALDRLVGEGLERHEALHAIGSVVATALWNITRRGAPVGRDAMARALEALRASDWRAERGSDPAPSDAIPLRSHEAMYEFALDFKEAIERTIEHLRRGV
jgi:hypothetical protein